MRFHQLKRFLLVLTLALSIFGVSSAALAGEPLVSNVFDNTFVIDALRDISSQTGVAILADATVQGQVTLSLENVPLEEALERVLAPGGYVFRKMDGYYLVGGADTKNPAFSLLSRTEVVKLRHAKAETAAKVLTEGYGPYVKVDRDSNSLVITAPDSLLARIKADLAVVDRPLPQVMIEALVVDVASEGRKEIGLDWKWTNGTGSGDSSILESGLFQVVGLETVAEYTGVGGVNKLLFDLKAAVGKGHAKVEANPRVVTLDGQVAEIFVGRDRYYNLSTTDNGTTTSRLEAIKTGITLKIQPQVGDGGDITVRIEPEVSDVVSDNNGGSDNFPIISRRKVATTVRVKTGESIVLGGLLQRTSHKQTSKVPLLGDLPILSLLFSSTKDVQEEGEVLIIITPTLMDGGYNGMSPRLTMPETVK